VIEPFELEIRSTLEALAEASEQAARWLDTHDVPPAASTLAHLGIEELVTNCIKYAYDDEREHIIRASISMTGNVLTLRVEDDGRPFNPLSAPEPDLSLPVDRRPLGGLGLHLLRTMSDRMTYERRNDVNCVTLEKALT
jgi:serine/threonine-protein kinase RsbW